MSKEISILSAASKATLIKTIVISGSVIITLAGTVGTLAFKLANNVVKEITDKQDRTIEFNKKIYYEVRILKDSVSVTNQRIDKVDESIKRGNKKFDVMEKHFKGLQNEFLRIDAGRDEVRISIMRAREPVITSKAILPQSYTDDLKKNECLTLK
jgi:peptidoglycan hydrolase CwlO-like protein